MNQQRAERRRDKFTLLIKSPKEILALDKGKFKTPPPMTTPVEKRNNNKLCEFHGEMEYNTDECMHLRRQIEELIKAGKMSQAPFGSKESNGSSYRTPHWFQRINHMANGTNITASKNRGCGGFNLYMDEFCGGEITIFVQWDHRKARGEENSGIASTKRITFFDVKWRLLDTETCDELLYRQGHSGSVYGLAFHPDGSLAASCWLGALARMWDLPSGRSILALEGHVKLVRSSTDFKPVKVLSGHESKVTFVDIAAHGQTTFGKEDVEEPVSTEESLTEIQTDAALLQKPEPSVQNDDVEEAVNDEEKISEIQTDAYHRRIRIQSVSKRVREPKRSIRASEFVETGSDPNISATLRGPPKRLDQTVNNTSKIEKEVTGPVDPVPYDNAIDTKNLPTGN
ncbi:reverse transcriptase domain-containing protein [Tanacetum coccineum]|uniref:Reverse transcriptase domain-containing protein n=1 Tax=Tanacetum coccineum TaxID=301880 RepID=A0ABQ5AXZ6_9ASTR